jgi:hypothetical protein
MLMLVLVSVPVLASDEKPATATGKPGPAAERSAAKDNASDADTFIPVNIPLFSSRFADFPIATVEDDTITVQELMQALAQAHAEDAGPEEGAQKGAMKKERAAGKKKYLPMLNRLITTRLIAHEARNMGLDDLPEVKEAIDSYSKEFLREKLTAGALEKVKPDEAEVEALYREMAKEYNVKSALFQQQDAAQKASEEIKKSKDFDGTIKKFVESKEAKTSEDGKYVKLDGLLPEVAQVVSELKVGSVSSVIPIERGFVILKLEDARLPQNEDPAARRQARQASLSAQKKKAWTAYRTALLKKYVELNVKLFNKLDYESKESAFEKYLKDTHVIAEIKGEKPLTVGELTEAIQAKLYHGVKAAFDNKSINEKKLLVLNEILGKRLELKEALSTGLDKTDEYKQAMRQYEESALFNEFIQKVIAPDIRVDEKTLKAYYESHKKEYSKPRMLKMSSIAFEGKKQADKAIARLRKGADFKWMKANADGIVTDAEELADENMPVLVPSLPAELRKEVDGAKPGDFRLYSRPNGLYYVVLIAEDIPERAQPFEAVSQQIRTKIINEQLNKSLDDWAAKLRGAYAVTIYLSESEK